MLLGQYWIYRYGQTWVHTITCFSELKNRWNNSLHLDISLELWYNNKNVKLELLGGRISVKKLQMDFEAHISQLCWNFTLLYKVANTRSTICITHVSNLNCVKGTMAFGLHVLLGFLEALSIIHTHGKLHFYTIWWCIWITSISK
jgi:hypothetical protein